MKDRVLEIMHREHLSNADFAKMLEISPASVSSIINGRNKVSLDVATKIIQTFEYVTWDWLILGKGELGDSIEKTPKLNTNQPSLFDVAAINVANTTQHLEYRKDSEVKTPVSTPENSDNQQIRYIEKPPRKIKEIRIFYDDNTYEIFEG
jgi:plasmid maintenance system antidote protein VapI